MVGKTTIIVMMTMMEVAQAKDKVGGSKGNVEC